MQSVSWPRGLIGWNVPLPFPSIATADFRHAIAQLRDRRRKYIGTSTTVAAGPPASRTSTPASGSPGEPLASAANRTPAATDQRPEESDEDYQLRKALEGSIDQRRQFIGEH